MNARDTDGLLDALNVLTAELQRVRTMCDDLYTDAQREPGPVNEGIRYAALRIKSVMGLSDEAVDRLITAIKDPT